MSAWCFICLMRYESANETSITVEQNRRNVLVFIREIRGQSFSFFFVIFVFSVVN